VKLLEKLAALEHVQWAHWTRYMLGNLTDTNLSRWEHQCDTPYSALSEKEKDSDRTWALKVLSVLGVPDKATLETLIWLINENQDFDLDTADIQAQLSAAKIWLKGLLDG
jgi:hypothetical protein